MGMRKTGLVWMLLYCAVGGASDLEWPVYLGGKDRSNYSTLDQINKSNVGQLEEVWTFDTDDRGEFQANPLIISGVLYTVSPTRKVIALGQGDFGIGQTLGRGCKRRRFDIGDLRFQLFALVRGGHVTILA